MESKTFRFISQFLAWMITVLIGVSFCSLIFGASFYCYCKGLSHHPKFKFHIEKHTYKDKEVLEQFGPCPGC